MKRQHAILAALVVMLKFSRLSSAPTQEIFEGYADNKDSKENSLASLENDRPPNVAYVASDTELGANGVILEFRRSIKSDNTEIEARRRSALDKGFMRFGRSGNNNVMRFGRSPKSEDYDVIPLKKASKNDKNFIRFGRSGNHMMRFGRNYNEPELYDMDGDDDDAEFEDIEELIQRPEIRGGDHKSDEVGRNVLRLGRLDGDNEDDGVLDLDNARSYEKRANLMRFGRGNTMMRFGRANNPMRFGKRNPMRFGRADPSMNFNGARSMMRLGRSNGNLMRFGRNDKNIMRFGKRSGPQSLSTSTKFLCKDDNCIVEESKDVERQQQSQDE